MKPKTLKQLPLVESDRMIIRKELIKHLRALDDLNIGSQSPTAQLIRKGVKEFIKQFGDIDEQ